MRYARWISLVLVCCGPVPSVYVDSLQDQQIKLICTEIRTGVYLAQDGTGLVEFEWCNKWLEI